MAFRIFPIICLALASMPTVHLQKCPAKERQVVTANAIDEVVFVTGPHELHYPRAYIRMESTGRYRVVARVDIYRSDVVPRVPAPNTSVTVHMEHDDLIQNITIVMENVQGTDSGEYILYDGLILGTLGCWTLYVLDADARTVDELIEAGTSILLNEFPHLDEDVAERMNVTTSWYLDDLLITQQQLYIQPDMNNKNLTYVIQERNHDDNTFRFDYTLRVVYTGSISFKPDKTYFILKSGETIPTIRCVADCEPPCDVHWVMDGQIISATSTLTAEFVSNYSDGEVICRAANSLTKKVVQRNIHILHLDINASDPSEKDVSAIVYGLVGLNAIFVLGTVVLIVVYCRGRLCQGLWTGPKKASNDNIEMDASNVSTIPVQRSNEPYQDLQTTQDVEHTYDDMTSAGLATTSYPAASAYENTMMST